MTGDKNKHDILTIYMNVEEAMSNLYKIYSKKFPDWYEFWFDLYMAEMKHAALIRGLSRRVESGEITFNDNRFDVIVISSALKNIGILESNAHGKDIEIKYALQVALDMENSLLEKNMYKIFETDSEALKKLLLHLHQETEEHKETVKKALETLSS